MKINGTWANLFGDLKLKNTSQIMSQSLNESKKYWTMLVRTAILLYFTFFFTLMFYDLWRFLTKLHSELHKKKKDFVSCVSRNSRYKTLEAYFLVSSCLPLVNEAVEEWQTQVCGYYGSSFNMSFDLFFFTSKHQVFLSLAFFSTLMLEFWAAQMLRHPSKKKKKKIFHEFSMLFTRPASHF